MSAQPPPDMRARGPAPELVLRSVNQPVATRLIALADVIARPSAILVMMHGQSRIFVMARAGPLPHRLASVTRRIGAPMLITVRIGLRIAAVAGFVRPTGSPNPPMPGRWLALSP